MCEKKIKKSIFAFLLIPLFIALGITIGSTSNEAYAALPGNGGEACNVSTVVYYFNAGKSTVTSAGVGTNAAGDDCSGPKTVYQKGLSGQSYVVGGANATCGNTITFAGTGANGTLQRYNSGNGGTCSPNGAQQQITVAANEDAAATAAAGDANDDDAGGAPTSCAIDGIGWAICPIANFFGSIVDGMYGLIEDNLLSIDTGLVANGVNSPTYQAWAGLLGIGNVIFVIIFLLIIFSQATGYGITNYGIKKLLPKLIIGVILINISYFICQAAVDISNILGYGLRGFFTTLGDSQQTISWATVTSQILAAGLAGGAIAVASLGIGLSGLLICVLTVVFIVLVLIIRKVLVIVCVVTAPIAFAAWLLPNTEKIFKLWWKVFYLMLIVFPVVSLVIGASALSSEIITKSLKDSANSSTFTGGGGGSF